MALGRSSDRAPSEPRRGDARLDHEARSGPPPCGAAVADILSGYDLGAASVDVMRMYHRIRPKRGSEPRDRWWNQHGTRPRQS